MGRLKIVEVAEAGFVTCQKASRTLIPLLQDLSSLQYLHVCHQMLFPHCVFDTFFSVFVAAAAVNLSLEYLLMISLQGRVPIISGSRPSHPISEPQSASSSLDRHKNRESQSFPSIYGAVSKDSDLSFDQPDREHPIPSKFH